MHALGYALAQAQFGEALLAAQSLQHEADLVLGRVMPPRGPADVTHHGLGEGLARFGRQGFLAHLQSFNVTMSQKSPIIQSPESVELTLMGDRNHGRRFHHGLDGQLLCKQRASGFSHAAGTLWSQRGGWAERRMINYTSKPMRN
jgi:hypothetical protein